MEGAFVITVGTCSVVTTFGNTLGGGCVVGVDEEDEEGVKSTCELSTGVNIFGRGIGCGCGREGDGSGTADEEEDDDDDEGGRILSSFPQSMSSSSCGIKEGPCFAISGILSISFALSTITSISFLSSFPRLFIVSYC